jgi:hypothetical protein
VDAAQTSRVCSRRTAIKSPPGSSLTPATSSRHGKLFTARGSNSGFCSRASYSTALITSFRSRVAENETIDWENFRVGTDSRTRSTARRQMLRSPSAEFRSLLVCQATPSGQVRLQIPVILTAYNESKLSKGNSDTIFSTMSNGRACMSL